MADWTVVVGEGRNWPGTASVSSKINFKKRRCVFTIQLATFSFPVVINSFVNREQREWEMLPEKTLGFHECFLSNQIWNKEQGV